MGLGNVLEELSLALSNLRSPEEIQNLTNTALSQNIPVSDVVEKGLRLGLQDVGRRYEEGEYFLSELLYAASILDQLMQTLRPRLTAESLRVRGSIVLGTVLGDIHDIGKNIFKMIAEAGGFRVVDLGVDVDAERFVQESKQSHPNILGLSCLLTTGLPEIKTVIEKLNQAEIRTNLNILIGGNAVTKEFAKQVGADAAALDAVQGADFCRSVTSP